MATGPEGLIENWAELALKYDTAEVGGTEALMVKTDKLRSWRRI